MSNVRALLEARVASAVLVVPLLTEPRVLFPRKDSAVPASRLLRREGRGVEGTSELVKEFVSTVETGCPSFGGQREGGSR